MCNATRSFHSGRQHPMPQNAPAPFRRGALSSAPPPTAACGPQGYAPAPAHTQQNRGRSTQAEQDETEDTRTESTYPPPTPPTGPIDQRGAARRTQRTHLVVQSAGAVGRQDGPAPALHQLLGQPAVAGGLVCVSGAGGQEGRGVRQGGGLEQQASHRRLRERPNQTIPTS